jgi:predicted amidophosphoribosyltransferase
MHVRVCRDCGEEYRPEILVCADCGGVLEDVTDFGAHESGALAPESERIPPPDLTGHRSVFQTREPRDLAAAAEALREAGLAFHVVEARVQNEERRSTLSIFVRDESAESATRLLAPLHGPEAVAYAERSKDRPLDTEEGNTTCPACDTAVPAGAPECPECGLVLSREDDPGEDR